MQDRIAWKNGPYGSQHGYLGDIRVLTLSMALSGPGWTLRNSLPGFKDYVPAVGEAEGKVMAEALTSAFLKRIGVES